MIDMCYLEVKFERSILFRQLERGYPDENVPVYSDDIHSNRHLFENPSRMAMGHHSNRFVCPALRIV